MKAFSFNGRISQIEYFFTTFFCIPLILGIQHVNQESILNDFKSSPLVLFIIPLLWLLWAQGSKRCHDIGSSGWMQVVPFYFLWMLFKNGDAGENKYGVDPKFNAK
jgi:uncharacterized membrane protein YhaH (DUF805 family)